MKQMKKILGTMLALVLVLAGCGGGNPQADTGQIDRLSSTADNTQAEENASAAGALSQAGEKVTTFQGGLYHVGGAGVGGVPGERFAFLEEGLFFYYSSEASRDEAELVHSAGDWSFTDGKITLITKYKGVNSNSGYELLALDEKETVEYDLTIESQQDFTLYRYGPGEDDLWWPYGDARLLQSGTYTADREFIKFVLAEYGMKLQRLNQYADIQEIDQSALPSDIAPDSSFHLVNDDTLLIINLWAPEERYYTELILFDINAGEIIARQEIEDTGEYPSLASCCLHENSIQVVTSDSIFQFNLYTLDLKYQGAMTHTDHPQYRRYSEDRRYFLINETWPGPNDPKLFYAFDTQTEAPISYAEWGQHMTGDYIQPTVFLYEFSDLEPTQIGIFHVDTGEHTVLLESTANRIAGVRNGRAVVSAWFGEGADDGVVIINAANGLQPVVTDIPNEGRFCLSIDGSAIGNVVLDYIAETMLFRSYSFDTYELIAEASFPYNKFLDYGSFSVAPNGQRFVFEDNDKNVYVVTPYADEGASDWMIVSE